MLVSDPAPLSWLEPRLYKDLIPMDSMYIPNNPQYGLQLEYNTTYSHSNSNPQHNGPGTLNGSLTTPLTLSPSPSSNAVFCSCTDLCCGSVQGDECTGNFHHHHHDPNIDSEPHHEHLQEANVHHNDNNAVLCQSENDVDDDDALVTVSSGPSGGTLCGPNNNNSVIGNIHCCDNGTHSPCDVGEVSIIENRVDCADHVEHSGIPTGTTSGGVLNSNSTSYWGTDDMGTFSLPPLDLDPLPSLFPFSPCSSNNYKSEGLAPCGKQPHDMADVLLSLKHAVVHPGQGSGGGAAPLSPSFATAYPQQPQLSYAMHPHQMLMSPSAYSGSFCDQNGMFSTSSATCQGHQNPPASAMFPSMSVNVSMNMTMHGYSPAYPDALQHQVSCPQMQWNTSPQTTSPVVYSHHQNQSGILSPGYPSGATYSFTADFRAPNVNETPLITAASSFKPVLNKSPFSSPLSGLRTRRPSLSYGSLSPVTGALNGGKVLPGALSNSEDESQRPNLCRICGKTYARPSTLKTHLRTHSGEKPYRCGDCHKSFSQAANLTAHVRTHSGEKPFRCPICDRRFSQSSSVTTHMRTHSGERPYRCRMCKKAFSDSSTLTKHLRIHSGEKPYQCKLCLLRFSQSGNLNRHMRVHGTNNSGSSATLINSNNLLSTNSGHISNNMLG